MHPRLLLAAAACLALTACFGGKTPAALLTLTPQAAPSSNLARSAEATQAVIIEAPVVSEDLAQVRVPAQEGPTTVTYIKDLQWVDRPNRMFQQLLTETVRRTTNRVVLDPKQVGLNAGLQVTGKLERFGYDVPSRQVVVTYDAALTRASGAGRIETRRFQATAPADGTAATVGPALNQAANQVALEFAGWLGS